MKLKDTWLRITSLKWISAVDAGAQGPISNVALVKRAPTGDEYSLTVTVAKVDEALGVVFGYAVASTVDGGKSPHIDLQGDAVRGGDELIKVALGFAEAGAQSDVMHDCIKDGWVPFVMPLTADTKKAFKLAGDVEGIAIGMKPSTATFKRFVAGELAGFSIFGTGIRTPLEQGKRAPKPGEVGKRGLLTSAEDGHSHLLDDGDGAGAGYTSCECMGEGDSATYHSHPWSRNDGDDIVIGMSAGHTHTVLDPANADEAAVEQRAPTRKNNSKSTPADPIRTVGSSSKETTKMNFAKFLAAFLAMSAAQRSYVEKLAPDEVEGFFGKSLSERETIAKAWVDSDPVVYKTKAGVEIRKSQGDIAVMLAKQNDEQAEQLAKTNAMVTAANTARDDLELAKRADDVLKGAGSLEARKDLLKSIDGIADEKRRAAALAIVKAGVDATERLMKATDHKLREGFVLPENGAGSGGPVPAETPAQKLRTKVEKFQADNKIPTYQQALNKAVSADTEIAKLFELART